MKKQISILLSGMLIASAMISPIQAKESSSIISYSEGSDGTTSSFSKNTTFSTELSGQVFVNEKSIQLLGTDKINIQTNYPIKEYIVVNDQDGQGLNDVLVYMDVPNSQDQLALISTETSEVIFSKNYMHINSDQNGKQFEENSKILQMEYIGDKIYILYNYHILCLDTSGNVVFDYINEDNIWKMAGYEEGIVMACQNGKVKYIDQMGKIVWDKQIVGKRNIYVSQFGENYDVQLNAWELYVDGSDIYVIGEDDCLYQLDGLGNVVNSVLLNTITDEQLEKIFANQVNYDWSIKERVFPSGVTTAQFLPYKIKSLSQGKIYIESYFKDHRAFAINDPYGNGVVELPKPKVVVYNMESQSVEKTMSLNQYNLKSGNSVYSTYKDQEVMIIPAFVQKGKLKIEVFSLESGELISQEILKIPAMKEEGENISITKIDDRYFIQCMNNVSFYLTNDLKEVEYVGDLSIASKLLDLEEDMIVTYSQSGKVMNIKRLGLNGPQDVQFDVALPEEYRLHSNGFEAIYYDETTQDILALVNVRGSTGAVESSVIFIIDSHTGNVLINDKVVLDKGIDEKGKAYTHYVVGESIHYFADLNQDGHREILVDQYVIDGQTLTLKSMYVPTAGESGQFIQVGDLNQDGVEDLIGVGETQAQIYYSKISGYDVSYVKSGIISNYAKELQNHVTVFALEDLDHDGIKDIVFNQRNDEGVQYYQVINSTNLQVKYDLSPEGIYDWGEHWEYTMIDFNHDQVDDLMYTNPNGEKQIISGANGQKITDISFKESLYDNSLQSPVAMEQILPLKIMDKVVGIVEIEDQNDDDIKDFLYTQRVMGQDYNDTLYLRICSGSDFSELSYMSTNEQVYSDTKLVPIKGVNKTIVQVENKSLIFDYTTGQSMATFNQLIEDARISNADKIIGSDDKLRLFLFDDHPDFVLNEVGQKVKGKTLELSWTSESDGRMEVFNQNEKIATTSKDSIRIPLVKGKQVIKLAYDDGQGKTTNQSIEVNVTKGNGLNIAVILGMLGALTLAVALIFYPKYKLIKKVGGKRG